MKAISVGFLVILASVSGAFAQRSNPGLKGVADAASHIVVVEVLDTRPRKAAEGARDTVKLRVIRTLKGPLQPGEEIGVYYHLLWEAQNVVEMPKFHNGARYTVFANGDKVGGFELADQWAAVFPDNPSLDEYVARARNEPGELWSDPWRPQANRAVVSARRIELTPEATVAEKKEGFILRVKITNHSADPITTRLAHEGGGGEMPPTDLYASVTHVQAPRRRVFEPVYRSGIKAAVEPTKIEPGESATVELRMDYPGSGPQRATPLMAWALREYRVQLLMVFEARGTLEYAAGSLTYTRIMAEEPSTTSAPSNR